MSLTLSLRLKTHTHTRTERKADRRKGGRGGERGTPQTVTAAMQLTTGCVKHWRSIITVITGQSRHVGYMYSYVIRVSG